MVEGGGAVSVIVAVVVIAKGQGGWATAPLCIVKGRVVKGLAETAAGVEGAISGLLVFSHKSSGL